MTAPITCLSRSTPVAEAANLLLSRTISSAPVINADGSLAGIVTERDIMENVGVNDNWSAPVERFMNEGVIQYDPHTPASAIFDFLCRVQIHRVIVVDEGRPIGLISRGTFLRWAQNHLKTGGHSQAQGDALDSSTGELLAPVISEVRSTQAVVADLSSWSRGSQVPSSDALHAELRSAISVS